MIASCSKIAKLRETPKAYEYQGCCENGNWPRRKTAMDGDKFIGFEPVTVRNGQS